ncbi:MAG TPA: branched-chain amino acid ABC transporter permease [Candidatus Entotheonella sp.]|jgi:branched-chain amino acid transport system permease protein
MQHAVVWNRRSWTIWIGLILLALVPVCTALTDQSFYLDLVNRLMILAIAALSLNLILGHGGMISFGHAVYLGIGAYCVGIPAYYGVYSGWVHFPLALGVSVLFALLTGAICLRTTGVYFIMITMAFAQMMFFALVSIETYGGDDGLVIEWRSEFAPWLSLEDHLTLYYVTFASLAVCLYLMHRMIQSRFGRVIEGTKGNERRMQAIGFNTYRYRLTSYIISGAMCGFAGALLGNFTNFISPEMMDWMRSGELIFMVILGGAGSLFGPVLGTAAFILLEEWLSGITIYWQLMFGAILILTVLFNRGGPLRGVTPLRGANKTRNTACITRHLT